jgi:hypothetical protein
MHVTADHKTKEELAAARGSTNLSESPSQLTVASAREEEKTEEEEQQRSRHVTFANPLASTQASTPSQCRSGPPQPIGGALQLNMGLWVCQSVTKPTTTPDETPVPSDTPSSLPSKFDPSLGSLNFQTG